MPTTMYPFGPFAAERSSPPSTVLPFGGLFEPIYDPRGGLFTNLVAAWESNQASGGITDDYHDFDLTDHNSVGSGTGKVYALARDYEASSSQYQTHVSIPELQVNNRSFTAEVWVKFESFTGSPTIIGKWSSGLEWLIYYTGSRLNFGVFGSGFTTLAANSFGAPSTGVWLHVVARFDAVAQEISIVVNNGTVDTTAHTTGIHTSSDNFAIGANGDGSAPFDGLIGPARLWIGRAITDGEVNRLWNNGDGLPLAQFGGPGDYGVGLKLWLDASIQPYADADPVPTWYDGSTEGNDGIASGADRPTFQTNELNSLPILRGDGTNTKMPTPIPASGIATYFFVIKKTVAGTDGLVYWGAAAALFVNSGAYAWYPNQGDGVVSLGGVPTDWSILTLKFSSLSSCTPYIDGVAGTPFDPKEYDSQTVLNLWGTGGDRGDYDIAEVIDYTEALSDADREAVEDYLTAKWFGGGGTGEGSGVGSLTLGGSGAGYTVKSGSGTGSITLGGSGAGSTVKSGSGTGALTLTVTSVGYTLKSGSGTGSITLSSTSVGYTLKSGSGTGSITLSGVGAGDTTTAGSGTGTITLSGQGTGEALSEAEGSGVGTITLSGTGVGSTTKSGSGTGTITLSCTSVGSVVRSGSGTGTLTLACVGAGDSDTSGSASCTITLSGSGRGYTVKSGSGIAAITLGSSATGYVTKSGYGVGTLTLSAIGDGEGEVIDPPSFVHTLSFTSLGVTLNYPTLGLTLDHT